MNYSAIKVTIEDDIGIITFNDSANPVNTWTDDITEGFVYALDDLKALISEQKIIGAVIISGKPGTFHTGANLNKMGRPDTKVYKMKSIEFNHLLLNRIASLPEPVVAAIEGHCMGGGMELALACSARIAKESPKTIIGLTEMNVGLFPAGGGTQRLPRLIGYPAVDLIMGAKTMNASQALEAGIVDRVVAEDADLLNAALLFVKNIVSGAVTPSRKEHDFSDLDSVMDNVQAAHLNKTRGRLLPAPKAFFRLMREGLKGSLADGLELEKKLFIDVSLSPECKGFIHAFFLKGMTDRPQKLMTPGFVPKEIKKGAVIGFGNMGRGIAICMLKDSPMTVVVKDTPQALEAGRAFVHKTLSGMFEKGRIKQTPEALMERLVSVTDIGPELADADIVIEAVFEDLSVKEELFRQICPVVPQHCIIASNTSGLSIDAMSGYVSFPERFVGLHFFSPVWAMQLVEVIRGKSTSTQTVDNCLNFAGLIRKRPLICNDSPGFVVNAMLAPFMRSALRYLEEGNNLLDIDRAMTDFGLPVGPLKLLDEVGIDVTYHVYKNRGEHQQTLINLYEAGFYGTKKNGKGFFTAEGDINPDAMALVHKREAKVRTGEEMTTDLLTKQVKVAKGLLENKVIDDPKMVDIGMLYGTGYPTDKGGPLKWADLIGLSTELFGAPFYP